MNGTGTRRSYGMEPAALSPFRDVKPSDRAMVKGYREEVMDGFVKTRPKYNPVSDWAGSHIACGARKSQPRLLTNLA